jgi:hypothetical protein
MQEKSLYEFNGGKLMSEVKVVAATVLRATQAPPMLVRSVHPAARLVEISFGSMHVRPLAEVGFYLPAPGG